MSAVTAMLRSMARRMRWLAGLALSATICGCAVPRPTPIPMQVLNALSGCAARPTTLVVMLPGAYSKPDEFIREGFVAALRERGVAADVAIADAHLGYFDNGSVLRRLREDVVLPARAAGYRKIWMVGISLGGFAALAYAAHHGADIDGVLAIAPYPGTQALQREIIAAGGPMAWRRTAAPPTDAELDRAVWWWLAGTAPARQPPVYLGHGRDDRFNGGLQLMATTLPAAHARSVPGGHDWPPWRALWTEWLERGLLDTGCDQPGDRKP